MRIAVHIQHALEQGMKIIQVRTVDTDVVTILVGAYFNLVRTHPEVEIWVAFGTGKRFCFYNINAIFSALVKLNQEPYTHFPRYLLLAVTLCRLMNTSLILWCTMLITLLSTWMQTVTTSKKIELLVIIMHD